MVDKTTDLRNTKQMAFCLRYIDGKLDVHEEFIEFYSLELTTAERSRAGGNILHVVWLVFSQSEEQWHV